MKVLLAGAFGHLGQDILRTLVNAGHEVTAADMMVRELDFAGFTPLAIDMTDKEKMKGICEGMDVVITTVGLTKASQTVTAFDIDYGANKNLLDEALAAGIKHFGFVSVLHADKGKGIPMADAKVMFENDLKASGINFVIYRPSGYFYDIAHIFQPKVDAGEVTLLKNKQPIRCNVIDTRDLADYIVEHMCDENAEYGVGGTEIYTYEEIANLFFAAAGKEPVIKYAPALLFDMIIAFSPKWKRGVIKFGKWTMTESMVAPVQTGAHSFKAFVQEIYDKGLKF